MSSPTDCRYLESHEWHRLEPDGLVTIGVSQFAVDELSDVTFVEVATGQGPIEAGAVFGEIESVKATSELYCGIQGEVEAVNQETIEDPSRINEDPFGVGWLIKVRPTGEGDALASLLTAEQYDAAQG